MAHAVETNLSEERLSGIVAQEQEVNQRKFRRLNQILITVLIAAVIGLGGIWLQSLANHDQGAKTQTIAKDAAEVANYVRDCLRPNSLTPEEKKQRCGESNGQAFFITYLNCAFLIHPADRTETQLNDCVMKGLAATGPGK
ncbi:MAG TPA: hypothetical protein VFI41_05330 [Gemmatimonadales bacterium]|nr:hypothetical protein [Gemmatimonadales bacterium]